MTRSAFNHVFINEWTHLSRSRKFRTHVQSWAETSGGLLSGQGASEIIEIIQARSNQTLGSQIARWLLIQSSNDDVAARLLLQALSTTVLGEAKRMDQNNESLSRRECESLCVSAAGLAVASKAGRDLAWPMWALYGAMRQEIRSINKSICDDVPFSPALLDTIFAAPADCRAAVEIGLILKHATAVGSITIQDAQLLFLRSVCEVPTAAVAADLGIAASSVRKKHARLVRRVSLAIAA